MRRSHRSSTFPGFGMYSWVSLFLGFHFCSLMSAIMRFIFSTLKPYRVFPGVDPFVSAPELLFMLLVGDFVSYVTRRGDEIGW